MMEGTWEYVNQNTPGNKNDSRSSGLELSLKCDYGKALCYEFD